MENREPQMSFQENIFRARHCISVLIESSNFLFCLYIIKLVSFDCNT